MKVRPLGRLAGLATLTLVATRPASAQDSTRTIDFSAAADTIDRSSIPDTVVRAAIARFNAPGTTRTHGTHIVAGGNTHDGPLGVHRGTLRVAGIVRGDVVVLNGDVRIDDGGHVTGRILVLGGRIVLAASARHDGERQEYPGVAPVEARPDGTVAYRAPRRGIAEYTAASATFTTGPVTTTVRADLGTYNRTEGLPIRIGPTATWRPDDGTTVRGGIIGILRTARDPDGLRSAVGWTARAEMTRAVPSPLTLSIEGGSTIVPMRDRAFGSLESGLSSLLLRRDYRDWHDMRGVNLRATYEPRPGLTVSLGHRWSRERTVRAVDAFSVLRSDESWRPNPVIDDGDFRTLSAGVAWDTRDDTSRPTSGWHAQGELRRVSSGRLTPVTLPALVRNDLPTSGYGSTEVDFDVRRYLRLDPRQSVHLRLAGGGWIGGDPLTVQRRRSMGGGDPMPGYDFREVNCDRRRRRDPALPPLCDRSLLVQAEFRRTMHLGVGTRLAGFSLGLEQVDVVAFGDAGTAWVAGDGAARVPSNRIQALDEWLADIGAGVEGRVFGVFLGKALTGDDGLRLSVRLQRRF